MNQPTSDSRGRALLIGIDAYPRASSQAQLQGCVRDVEIAQRILADVFGLTPKDATILRNEEATREAILDAMENLLEQTRTGDRVYFHFSGHGRRVQAPDSPSGFVEAIVPSDSGTDPHPNLDIFDYEIADWIHRLDRQEGRLLFVFDSCFSGSISHRGLGACRGLAAETRSLRLPSSRWPPGAGEKANSRGLLPSTRSHQVLFAACAAEQYAREIESKGDESGKHGAFSFFFYRELSSSRSQTYRELFDRVGAALSAQLPQQNPQLEGAIDLEIHGQELRPPEPFVLVRSCRDDSIVLGGGAVHGIAPESEWLLEPPGSLHPETGRDGASPASVVKILEIGTLECNARLIRRNPLDEIEAGWRAFLYRTAPDFRLPVYADPASRAAGSQALVERLSAMPSIRLASEPKNADLTICTIAARGRVGPEDIFPELGALSEDHFLVLHRDGSPLGPALPVAGSSTIDTIAENLQRRGRFLNLLNLSPLPSHEAQLRVAGTLLRQQPDSRWVPVEPAASSASGFSLRLGERLGFRLENRGSLPFFPYVFFLGWEGEIVAMFPAAIGGHEALRPGQSLDIGKGHVRFTLTPSQDGQALPGPLQAFVKVVAATRPVAVDLMAQEGYRSRGDSANTLENLFDLALGCGKAGTPRPLNREEDVEWTTCVSPFQVLASWSPLYEPTSRDTK